MRILSGVALLALAVALQPGNPVHAAAMAPSKALTDAIADPSRPDKDKEADAHRKPAEVLTFAGVKPGDKVAELLAGGGYYTRIFCGLVGDKGHVYTIGPVMPAPKPDAPPRPAPPTCPNLTTLTESFPGVTTPEKVDVIWTSENYHDLHNDFMGKPDIPTLNKAIFDALKPGGIYMIEDHAAAAGTGIADTNTLHRIDEAAVKQEVTAAGFVFVGESDVLKNPDDPHTAKVFDPSIRGKTDKFLLKFKKP